MKYLKLESGNNIPQIGFGTWQLTGDTAHSSILTALEVGYRHIDTADRYGNHKEVAKAIAESRIKRGELFITTKQWRSELDKDSINENAKRFLDELQTNYIDLLLIHWPNKDVPIEETLSSFEDLKSNNIIKSYGVSNFTIQHLQKALDKGFHPDNNQVEFHPSFNQKELKEYCDKNKIILTAYSPIAQGEDLKLKEVRNLAYKYGKSEAQVIINWLIQSGIVAIPRSAKKDHIEDNFKATKWGLEKEDIKIMNNLDSGNRMLLPDFHEFDN